MKLAHSRFKPSAMKARIALAALAAFSALACASHNRAEVKSPAGPKAVPPQSGLPAPERQNFVHSGPLTSEWESGSCALEGSRLTYSDDSSLRRATMTSDAPLEGAEKLICSADYSVVILPDKAIVALGGNDIIEGREMLGFMGGRFVVANSVIIPLGIIIDGGAKPASAELEGRNLKFASPSGGMWAVDVSNPFGDWNIY